MNGHVDFQYSASFSGISKIRQFVEVRNWCIDQWGSTIEYDIQTKYDIRENQNPAWSWERTTSNKTYKIYLASTNEASWFTLKWL